MGRHNLLKRQLEHCHMSEEKLPQSLNDWQEFLKRVNNAYQESDDDRYLLEHSQEVASKEMQELNEQLVGTARLAGMAEIATSVLHNIGNVLNSINVSITVTKEKIDKLKDLNLAKVIELLKNHTHDFPIFVTQDPQGKLLFDYLEKFQEVRAKINDVLAQEMVDLSKNVEHIKNVINSQQSISGSKGITGPVNIRDLINEALKICLPDNPSSVIKVVNNVDIIPAITSDKLKIQQILINLVRNAKESVTESDHHTKQILLNTHIDKDSLLIEVVDNGKGIIERDIDHIFTFGFTTKEKGHGYGLHSCALLAKELNGSLKAYSDGLDKGAKFILEIPYQPIKSTAEK